MPVVSSALNSGEENSGTAEVNFVDSVVSSTTKVGTSLIGNAIGATRMKVAGLLDIVNGKTTASVTAASWLSTQTGASTQGTSTEDWRVKVTVNPAVPFMSTVMLQPLKSDMGVTFPILPQISTVHLAKYSSQALTHSNYAAHFYDGSEVSEIQINGEFVVQSVTDGQYLLAAIQFFRSVTKMFFGNGALAGTPPPLVYLDGFGKYYFPHVSCVVKSFTHTITPDVDYIEIPSLTAGGGITRLPTQSTIQLQLQPIYSRASVAKFSLTDFANGDLITNRFI